MAARARAGSESGQASNSNGSTAIHHDVASVWVRSRMMKPATAATTGNVAPSATCARKLGQADGHTVGNAGCPDPDVGS